MDSQIIHLRQIAKRARKRALSSFEAIDVEEGLKSLKENEQWETIVEIYHVFGFLNRQQGNRELARELVEATLQAAKALNRRDIEARLLHDLAEIHHQQGRNRQALELFENSYLLRMEIGARFDALKSKHMSVLVLRALGEHNKAYRRAQEVLDEARELSDQNAALAAWIAHPLEVLAIFAGDSGELRKARKLIEEAISIHLANERDDKPIMLSQCYRRLGQLMMRERQWDQAEAIFLESLDYSRRANNSRLVATALRFLGDLYVQKRKYEAAIEQYSKAMDIAVNEGLTPEQMALSLSFARLYFKLGRIYDAFEEFRNAVFLWKALR